MTKRSSRKSPDVTRSTLTWRHVTCRVVETRNFLTPGTTQLEIRVTSPKGAPLPITTTGYRAEYVSALVLSNAGGAHLFFIAWLNRAASNKAYLKAENAWRQPSLF